MEIKNNICLMANDDKEYKLSDFNSKYLLLYFYPKDNTPGCTREAIDFTNLKKDFKEFNIEIVGVSPDSIAKHKSFVEKKDLDILLLSDRDKKLSKLFGVWGEKKNYGITYIGMTRSSFLINLEKNEVVMEWRNVKATGHAERILEEIKKN